MAKKTDPRVDLYVSNAEEFAKPILSHLRAVVHKACPDVQETIKWSFPHFDYQGKILCSMASFKHHCSFGFRLASAMKDSRGLLTRGEQKTAMGQLGKIAKLADLPSEKILMEYIKQAMTLTDQGTKAARAKSEPKELLVPPDFMKMLRKQKAAYETFRNFSYSHKKEYVEWITEAKTPETRNRRMARAVEWMQEGKGRNWKYE
jgi:uncharacterized protein YdeI (YjbR/CyaY-like superfamily)